MLFRILPSPILLGFVSILLCTLAAKASSAIHPYSFVSRLNPSHSLQFMQPKLCDPDVVQYSGYMEIDNESHYFFWFFESKRNPANAPLTAWLNGGPGCSSMIGLWEELGPCRVNQDGTQDASNPHSWHRDSNLLFFDQPDNVGFSYGVGNVRSTVQGSDHAYKFLQLFYEAFPKYSKLPFHYFGESYGGHYVPEFANYILRQNQAIASGEQPGIHVPLESIGIGNGWTDALVQYKYSATMACDSNYGAVLSPDQCEEMKKNYLVCAEKIKKCRKLGRNRDCVDADAYCTNHVEGAFSESHRSVYDVRVPDTVLDPPSNYIPYLNRTEVRALIGAKTDYKECPPGPYRKFAKTGDNVRSTAPAVADLLNAGIRVLLYAGDADYICNWLGNYAWSSSLAFHGRAQYRTQSLQPWIVDDREAGQVQSGGNLTFIRVYEAGHEVPYYQPVAALDMFQTWIRGNSFRSR